ncbi:tail fiber domain-containing protein [Candidatus Kaiserbacteria bacterium]|nr:tail fiber domain-containing protein [Candidatus Kaiserbacteria bacterium]
MRRISISSVLCVLALSLPIATSALTVEDIRQQIAQLLAQIEALQQQIAQTPTTAANDGSATASAACFRAYRNLFRGLRGSDVEELQRFLLNTGDFTFGEITGFFGSATERAVQRFQCRELGICSGSPESNGYGFVGARTRAAMSARCSSQRTTQTQSFPPATVYQCPTITQPSCTNGTLSSLGNDTNGCHRGWLCEIRTVVQNNAPRLELSGPGSLWLNEAGTWTVKATDPDGDNVSVNMYFGNESTDELLQQLAYPTSSKSFTRTRSFTNTGSYAIRVEALDTFNNSARITSVVQVRAHTCTVNGTTLEHGASKTLYSQTTAASGSTCSAMSQTRTCDNGTVSGSSSYQYTSCMEPLPTSSPVPAPSPAPTPSPSTGSCIVHNQYCGDTIIPNGDYAYHSCCAVGLIRLCQNGVLVVPGPDAYNYLGTSRSHTTNCPADPSWYSLSDIRLKEHISPIQDALSKLSQLHGIFFNWKNSSMPQEQQMGVIAQEVQKVFPEAVIESNGVLYVNYYALIAPIIEAIKELKLQNDELRAQLDAIKQ